MFFRIAVFLALVFLIVWLFRGSRRAVPPPGASARGERPLMVACAQCGLHLPSADALPGRGGVFCGEAHRAEFERRAGVTPP